jgi:hypothetical protein
MGFMSPHAKQPPPLPMMPSAAHPPTLGSAMSTMTSKVQPAGGLASVTDTSQQGLKTPPSTAPVSLLGQ